MSSLHLQRSHTQLLVSLANAIPEWLRIESDFTTGKIMIVDLSIVFLKGNRGTGYLKVDPFGNLPAPFWLTDYT